MKQLIPFLLVFTFCLTGLGTTEYSPSGLLQSFSGSRKYPSRFRSHDEIARAFLKDEFSSLRSGFQWDELSRIPDKTHTHFIYQWTYAGRPVLDHFAKVHVSVEGSVELASSSLVSPFSLQQDGEQTKSKQLYWKERITSDWQKKIGKFQGRVQVDPVVWVNAKNQLAVNAFDVRVIIDRPWTLRHYVMDEVTGAILEEKQVSRSATATVKVFKKNPSGSASPTSVTLTDLADTSSLRNSYLWVRREKIAGTTASSVEVEPTDYSTAPNYKNSPTPAEFIASCTLGNGDNTACANMSFDAVNAYYHLTNYRNRINGYFTQLGASVSFPYDAPVNSSTGATNTFSILVNPVSIDFGAVGLADDVNNALYVGEPCRSDGSMDRCMVFLRPATLSAADSQSNCGTSSSTLYDLAREGIVVAHEYQHYVTDTITHIAFSPSSAPKVGDALHEAYSDYLAASYVTDLNGTDVTLVGEYALSECTRLQRELNVLRVYDDTDATNADPHTSGISWASAFWKLRTEYGATVADLLAIKSLFYLSATPGFFDAIEAVVKADEAVYQGAHVSRIRQLFYGDVKFVGGATIGSTGIAEVGFKGCAAVHSSKTPSPQAALYLLFWISCTLVLGRMHWKAKH